MPGVKRGAALGTHAAGEDVDEKQGARHLPTALVANGSRAPSMGGQSAFAMGFRMNPTIRKGVRQSAPIPKSQNRHSCRVRIRNNKSSGNDRNAGTKRRKGGKKFSQ